MDGVSATATAAAATTRSQTHVQTFHPVCACLCLAHTCLCKRPAQIPAAVTYRLIDRPANSPAAAGVPVLSRLFGRRLLDTEKYTFTTDTAGAVQVGMLAAQTATHSKHVLCSSHSVSVCWAAVRLCVVGEWGQPAAAAAAAAALPQGRHEQMRAASSMHQCGALCLSFHLFHTHTHTLTPTYG